MLITANMVHLALCWALAAFAVSTVAIAVQRVQLSGELNEVKYKLDYLETQLEGEAKPKELAWSGREDSIDYRLPKNLKPINYDIYLHPDFAVGNFTGQESITINVIESSKNIVLHSLNLNIKSVYVTAANGQNLQVESFEFDKEREFLIINMVEELVADSHIKLGILFSGEMSNKIVGLYSSSYWTPENEQRTIATSKFEPTYARQAFPCFDEPAMKATFDIVLVRPTEGNYHALSNMDISKEENQGDYTEVYFSKSVPMSTYLACFIVSDFVSNKRIVDSNGIGENFEIRAFATAHQLNKIEFALDTAVAVTEFFIDYYQVEYPLPKLDLAAIPDFAANAMEHWGLVTFRETALLYDENYSSTWNKQRVAAVVTHELAHMWFGNLVTMNWWNDLWLNEGFARYMEYKGVGAIYADWGMSDQFLIHALHSVLQFDSRTASHPIIQTVESPNQITEIFDTISYEKGASVIRMLEDAVGAEKFAEGVNNYLENYKYSNAVTGDFIAELKKLKLDFDVEHFMRTWTEQMGYPMLDVRRTSPSAFVVTQKRFFSNIEDYNKVYDDSEFNYTWTIPITYYTDYDSKINRAWFDNNVEAFGISVPTETKWLKFNIGQVGYYRVNYDDGLWQEIIKDLIAKPESFTVSDRAHLLNDIFAMADASQLSYDIAMQITKYLSKENDFVPWYVAASKLQALQSSLMYREAYVEYLKYARNLLKDIYATVGWEIKDDSHTSNRLRVTILTAACALGMPECLSEASRRFTNWLSNPTVKPSPDLREIIYYYGMQQVGDEETWDAVWDIFVAENDSSEKNKLMYGLAGVKVPWLLYRFIELVGEEKYVRQQDYFTCIQNIAGNPMGEPLVWEYYREQWPHLVERFGLNDRYFGRMITSITARFDTNTKLEEMQEFFDKYPSAGAGEMSRKQAIETVKYNVQWLLQNEKTVGEWLKEENTNK